MLNLLTKINTIMKKRILLLVAVVMAAVVSAYAQPRAIGARIGYGVEVSYQHSLASNRMINLDAGIPAFLGLEAAVTHDWIDPFGTSVPWNERGEWHWYMGVGGGLSWYWAGALSFGVGGRVGVEYDFWFPMQLSVDWRPMFGPGFTYNGATAAFFNTGALYAGAICLGIRYNF